MIMSYFRLLAAVIALVVFSTNALAKLPENNKPFEYYAKGEPLRAVLASFASSYKIPVKISPAVNDVANGSFKSTTAEGFLNKVSKLYDLDWYYDGRVLHLSKNSETQSQLLTLSSLKPAQLEKMLKKAGMWDERFRWRQLSDKGVLYLSGPPRFVSLVSETAAFVEQQANDQINKTLAIEIFPLRHAPAMDRSYQMREQKMSTPGIASILNKILLSHQEAGIAAGGATKVTNTSGKEAQNNQAGASSAIAATAAPMGARIEAIPQMNAVLVQDTPQRMEIYRTLIAELDRPQPQVEISLSIIDVNANNMDELGVDWNLTHNLGGGNSIQFVTPGGLDPVKTVVGSNITNFVSRVKMLSQKGKARIASRPAILTENNTEAVLDFSSTFYVPLKGREVAQLESVDYGTILNLQPRVIEMPGKNRVALKIHIEDGAQDKNASVSGSDLPLVNRTKIDTVATINENESLLIGGYFKDLVINGENKIPLLGDIPLLGRLFKSKTHRVEQTVRLFLLQPRILEPGRMNDASDIAADQLLLGKSVFGQDIEQLQHSSDEEKSKEQAQINSNTCYPTTISSSIKAWLISQGYDVSEEKCTAADGKSGFRIIPKNKAEE